MKTPETIINKETEYKQNAWEAYTISELGEWVHLFTKRASHRTDTAKIEKDLTDAQNYLNMIQSHIDQAREELL